jgi:hypothetical protein
MKPRTSSALTRSVAGQAELDSRPAKKWASTVAVMPPATGSIARVFTVPRRLFRVGDADRGNADTSTTEISGRARKTTEGAQPQEYNV